MKLNIPSVTMPAEKSDSAPRSWRNATLSHLPHIATVAAIALTIFALYLAMSSTRTPVAPTMKAPTGATPAHADVPDVETMVTRLAARLQKEPDNGAGWQMLGQSYAALGRFAEAASAYSKATKLLPPNATLLADHADILAMAQSGSFQGEPIRLIRKALELDPRHPKALTLAGTEALKRNDLEEALRYWNRALALIPANNELAESVRSGIAEIKNRQQRAVEKSPPKSPTQP